MKIHEEAPVYKNENGKYLYRHKKGQWRINNVINKRGVIKGRLSDLTHGPCVTVERMTLNQAILSIFGKNEKWVFAELFCMNFGIFRIFATQGGQCTEIFLIEEDITEKMTGFYIDMFHIESNGQCRW